MLHLERSAEPMAKPAAKPTPAPKGRGRPRLRDKPLPAGQLCFARPRAAAGCSVLCGNEEPQETDGMLRLCATRHDEAAGDAVDAPSSGPYTLGAPRPGGPRQGRSVNLGQLASPGHPETRLDVARRILQALKSHRGALVREACARHCKVPAAVRLWVRMYRESAKEVRQRGQDIFASAQALVTARAAQEEATPQAGTRKRSAASKRSPTASADALDEVMQALPQARARKTRATPKRSMRASAGTGPNAARQAPP